MPRPFLIAMAFALPLGVPALAQAQMMGQQQDQSVGFSPAKVDWGTGPQLPGNFISEDQPVMLTADQIDYLQQEEKAIATGHVEVVQGETTLLADHLIYDKAKDTVIARGNVSVMDATGNVLFADEVELRDQMRVGAINQFKARMTDDSLFAARHAERQSEEVTVLENAVYSPCKVECVDKDAPPIDPLWQLRADRVKIDRKEQVVTYKNAWMEVFGLPVIYTPYMSHATPDADSKSGFMFPEYERTDNLGNVYKLPFFWAIAPDRDLTVIPIYTSQEGSALRTNYRQQFETGEMSIDASITRPQDRDAAGNLIQGNQIRGHLFAAGRFDVDDTTRWGFDIRRTTDDTYLRKYDIDEQTLLISRVYGEGNRFLDTSERNSLSVEGIAFQGLASTDNSDLIPMVLPLVTMQYESDPMAGGARYFMESNAMLLTREIGAKSRRLSNTVGLRLPYITDNGQVIEVKTQLRGDIYDVEDVALNGGNNFDGTTGRLVPEASVLWRYPFINQMENSAVILEPIVNAVISPGGGNPDKIPNEDSLVPEFTDTNLFSSNRFAGYDRIESGPRVSYGMRAMYNYDKAYVDALVGQHYRTYEDRNFPFSNNLNDNLSDYVGKISLQYMPLYVAYRFRLDKESLSERRREVDVTYTGKRFTLYGSYTSLKNDPVFATREEVVGTARVNLTKRWSIGAGARRDLLLDQFTTIGGEIAFKNECFYIANVISREYTRDRELKPSTNYMLQFSLKNIN